MTTAPRVTFGLYDLEINADSTPAAADLQSFSKISDLKTGNVMNTPYITYEPDYWLLDGTYKFLPDDEDTTHVGMMSTEMSDADGDFGTDPVLNVTFNYPHSSDGLVLRFGQYSGDWADDITVAYYDYRNVLICTDNYAPDAWEYEIDKDVADFQKIVITFHATNKPYRYLRLTGIDYGQLVLFDGSDIVTLQVSEEMDMLGASVPSNECDLTLFSTDPAFSILNPTGYYARLAERQPLSIYEVVNGTEQFVGRFYLDTWENQSASQIHFACMDAAGVMSRIPYRGGLWLPSGILSQDIIEDILGVAALPYDLDPALYDIPVIGWIPLGTCRDALQQVAFAIGAYVECSRSSVVKIRASVLLDGSETDVYPITVAEKGASGQTLKMRSLVTGVEITSHNYSLGTDPLPLFTGTLPAGSIELQFQQPAHTLVATGATISESGANFAILTVNVAGTVTLTGLNYVDNQRMFYLSDEGLGPYVIPNILKISMAYLIGTHNGDTVIDRVYSYHQERFVQSVRLFAPSAILGQICLVDAVGEGQVLGVVEKMDVDLVRGFAVNAEIRGVVRSS